LRNKFRSIKTLENRKAITGLTRYKLHFSKANSSLKTEENGNAVGKTFKNKTAKYRGLYKSVMLTFQNLMCNTFCNAYQTAAGTL
jgi:hypothetical protein